jgi:hypothetical protein
MEFLLTETSNGLMHKSKEFERLLFQMLMEIEKVKISRSSGNHGIVTIPASASSSGNFIEGSKEETEILTEVRRCWALENLANPIEKDKTCARLPLKSWNIPPRVARFFSNRVNIFSAQRILISNFTQTLSAFSETAIRKV